MARHQIRLAVLTASLLVATVGATACGADSPTEVKPDKDAFCAEIRAVERSDIDVDEDLPEVRRVFDERLIPLAPDAIRDDLETWSDAAHQVDTADEFGDVVRDDPEVLDAVTNLAEYYEAECEA